MPRRESKTSEDINGANRAAIRGGVVGAAKWGLIGGGLAFAGVYLSPIYRNLTIQFKLYIQLSFMTFGGMIEADRRLHSYEYKARLRRKQENDAAVWNKWEDLLEEEERLEKLKEERQKDEG